jgi:hypothetical protein
MLSRLSFTLLALAIHFLLFQTVHGQTVNRVRGSLACKVTDVLKDVQVDAQVPIPNVPVELVNFGRTTNSNDSGTIDTAVQGSGNTVTLKLKYDWVLFSGSAPTRLMVMDDFHNPRSDEIVRSGTVSGGTLDLGTVVLPSVDCELWRIGVKIVGDYVGVRGAAPPARELRIKRWAGVVVGSPHAFYDYIVIRTDFLSDQNSKYRREGTLYHEFGHSIRHVADGDMAHWNWDNFRWAYARNHDGTEVANVQYAFNEGWANYWRRARFDNHDPYDPKDDKLLPNGYRDWNERLVANRLLELSKMAGGGDLDRGDRVMVEVLEQNPEQIHSLYDFELKLFSRLKQPAPPPPASCPPGYTDDGATCRRDVRVVPKPSYGRGVGAAPKNCGPGQQYDAGLCYPVCKPGYRAVGPVCWGSCPAGYDDHGATCYRGASIIGANNSRCPWYDKCGLVTAKGCSTCPPGYRNDGCTCRRDVHVTGKPSYGRGAGSVPTSCPAGQEKDAGLCYPVCNSGFRGVGPVCWGSCPEGFDDHGATCYRGTSIIVKY